MLVTKVPSMILEVNHHSIVDEAAAHREQTGLPKVLNSHLVKKQLSE